MARRMSVHCALTCLLLVCADVNGFVPGVDGPLSNQEALEGRHTSLLCDTTPDADDDQLMLLVWYQDNVPIYSYDARIQNSWSYPAYNTSHRLTVDLTKQPTQLTVNSLRGEDQGLYHCRVDFLLAPTRNIGVNLTVIVLPSKPFFLDELGNKVEDKIGPYHEGDTLVLSCLVIGGRPPPQISWYSGEILVDASDRDSDIPGVRENELYLPLSRENAASLSCRASNTKLTEPVVAALSLDLYLSPYNVSIHWARGTADGTLRQGRVVAARCVACGARPQAELSWWLGHTQLTHQSNQTWDSTKQVAVSYLEITPSVDDNGATLACVATNPAMAPSRGSKTDVITLNVIYSPIVEVTKIGGSLHDVVEHDSLHLDCDVRANPLVDRFIWYFNDIETNEGILSNSTSSQLLIENASRRHAGSYSCAAHNAVGETRADEVFITVLYPPECIDNGIELNEETIHCNVNAIPSPEKYLWLIEAAGLESQHATTATGLLPLSQVSGSLSGLLKAACEASNGVSSQQLACHHTFSLEHLRPKQPQQCDLVYEDDEFYMRCMPVENASYYEVSVWRISSSNTSLILTQRGSMGFGPREALSHSGVSPWLLRGRVGELREGDEAGARACNRYGCSQTLLLRPTRAMLYAAQPPWWEFLVEKEVAMSAGAVVLVAAFVLSTYLCVRVARRARSKPAPVIQVLQLDDVAMEYLENVAEQKLRASSSFRSSVYSDDSNEWAPAAYRTRTPRVFLDPPPPDVTLTLHRESAV